MKQKRFTARWQTYYFKLEDGFLTHYEKKSLVGTRKNKVGGTCGTSKMNRRKRNRVLYVR